MRNELDQHHKIDQYLAGSMVGEELSSFEASIAADPALAAAIADQRLFLQAINRSALRAEIATITGASGSVGMSFWKLLTVILGSVGVIAVLIIWMFSGFGNENIQVASSTNAKRIVEEPQNSSALMSASSLDTVADSSLAEDAVKTITRNSDVKPKVKGAQLADSTDTGELGNQRVGTRQKKVTSGKLDGLHTFVEPDIQRFSFRAEKGKTIEGKDGTVVFVPTNAFLDSSGNVVEGTVKFQLVEALSLEDILLYNLTTKSGNKLLQTGGMVYVDAEQDGEKLAINPGRPLYIEVPTNETKPGMMAFKGEVDQNGNIDWVDPQPLKRYLTKVDLGQLDFLPPGFSDEVHANMPFKSYKTANEELVDSLYYALASQVKPATLIDEEEGPIVESTEAPLVPNTSKITSQTGNMSSNLGRKIDVVSGSTGNLNGKIKGKVLSKNTGDGIPYASIKVFRDGQLVSGAESDMVGEYLISSLAPGSYDLEVEAVGYLTQRVEEVQITSDKIQFNDFKLSAGNGQTRGMYNEVETRIYKNELDFCGAESKFNNCGITPASIQTVRTNAFSNTFIATKEFEERLAILHQLHNGQELLDLYVNNLNKDMGEVDRMVVQKLSGNVKEKFQAFADQNLTNLEEINIHQDQISAYYEKKRVEYQRAQNKLQRKYEKMNTAKLHRLINEVDQINDKIEKSYKRTDEVIAKFNKPVTATPEKANVTTNAITASNQQFDQVKAQATQLAQDAPPVNAAEAPRYSVPWYSTGWMNIDAYLKDIDKNPREVKILAKSKKSGVRVYQWLNSLRTMVEINMVDNEGVAKFPKKGSEAALKMWNTSCFAVVQEEDGYMFAEAHYNPYKQSEVTVSPEPIAIETMRKHLQSLDPKATKLASDLERMALKAKAEAIRREKARQKREEEARREAERIALLVQIHEQEKYKRAALRKERQAVNDKMYREQKRLLAEYEFMQNLACVAFPCKTDLAETELEKWKPMERDVEDAVVEFPGSFSPNGDGYKDTWTPLIMNAKSATMKIADPETGELLFESTFPNVTWDGGDLKGKIVKEGVYWFDIQGVAINDKPFSEQGNITLEKPKAERERRVVVSPSARNLQKNGPTKSEISVFGESLSDPIIWYIEKNCNYPFDINRDSPQGQVLAELVVDSEGEVSVTIKKTISQQLSDEVIRVLKSLPEAYLTDDQIKGKTHSVAVLFMLK